MTVEKCCGYCNEHRKIIYGLFTEWDLTKNQSSTARSGNLKKHVPSGTGMVSTFVHLSTENEGAGGVAFLQHKAPDK